MSGDMGIGASAPRTEDRRFITGRGRYVDDINLQSQQHAWFVRSPHPHAEVRGVDAADALKLPGVTAVLTGADMQADDIGPLPVAWGITSRDGSPAHEPVFPALATDRVRYVGNPVAVVVAETRTQARDAAEMVNVHYEELESVSSATAALEEGAPQIHEGAPGNLCYDWEWLPAAMAPDAKANTDKAFKERPRTSCRWSWSTTGWSRTRWSRAPAWRTSTRQPASSRCTPPARTRMSIACCCALPH